MSWLKSIIDFLNANNGTITALATVVLAGITLWYALLAQKMLKVSDTPEVKVLLSQNSHGASVYTLDLCIQNIGTGFAHDVKFTGDFLSFHPQFSNGPLTEYDDLKNGLSYLGSGKQIQIALFFQYKQSDLPVKKLNAVVNYKDSAGKGHKRTFDLDFTEVVGYRQIGDPSLYSIASSLQSIDKHLLDLKKERDSQNQQYRQQKILINVTVPIAVV